MPSHAISCHPMTDHASPCQTMPDPCQPMPALASLCQPMPAHASLCQPMPAHARPCQPMLPMPAYASPYQPTSNLGSAQLCKILFIYCDYNTTQAWALAVVCAWVWQQNTYYPKKNYSRNICIMLLMFLLFPILTEY